MQLARVLSRELEDVQGGHRLAGLFSKEVYSLRNNFQVERGAAPYFYSCIDPNSYPRSCTLFNIHFFYYIKFEEVGKIGKNSKNTFDCLCDFSGST